MGYPVRPSGYVGWGSTGMTNTAEPTDAKKSYGWAVNEQPPSSYFNWIHQKQDEWAQYLGWRSLLSPVVQETFIPAGLYGWTGTTNGGSTGLGYWQIHTPSQVNTLGSNWDVTLSETPGDDGRQYIHIGSGYAHILANVGGVRGRDFKMEHVVMFSSRPASSGYSIEAGLMYNHSGVSGCNMQLGWVATGRSGQLSAVWRPSGANPTSMNFASGYAAAAGHQWSSHHKLTVESRGPTMAFYSNDRFLGAAPAVAVGGAGAQQFGVRVGGQSGAMQFIVESMGLEVSRP
jgi:hypothetical protein